MSDSINKKLTELINGMGALTEMWLITYKLFIDQGLDKVEALDHTRALVQAILTSNNNRDSNNGN